MQNGCFRNMDDYVVHTTPNHPPPQNWTFFQKLFFKSSLLLNGYSALFKYVPQIAATTFAFSSVCFFFFYELECFLHRAGQNDVVKHDFLRIPVFFSLLCFLFSYCVHNIFAYYFYCMFRRYYCAVLYFCTPVLFALKTKFNLITVHFLAEFCL